VRVIVPSRLEQAHARRGGLPSARRSPLHRGRCPARIRPGTDVATENIG